MASNTQKARLIHLWWFVALILIIVSGVVYISIYNTNELVSRAEKNQAEITKSFRYLRSQPEWKLVTDSLGRSYIDSVRVPTSEQAAQIETLLISNATRQLTEHSQLLVKETASLNNTLILWATVLTLLSIIFTFLGFMELRDRFSAVEEKRQEMDEAIEKAVAEVNYKIQELYHTLDTVRTKREEMDVVLVKAQNSIARITDQFEDLTISTIEDIELKIKEVDQVKLEVVQNESASSFNLKLQTVLLKPVDKKIKALSELITEIEQNTILDKDKKDKLLAEAYFYLAHSLDDKGNIKEAIAHYNKAIELSPNASMYNNRGVALKNIGEFDKALADYNKAIEATSEFAEAHNNRGIIYALIEKPTKAIDDFVEAIRIKPDFAEAFYNKGKALAETGDHQNAIGDYNKALKLDNDLIKTYYRRGLSHKALNLIEEALDDFDKCIELDPDNKRNCRKEAQSEINRIKEIDE